MIIDGRAIATDLLASVRADMEALGRTAVVRAVVSAPSAATRSYLSIKAKKAREAGMALEVAELSAEAGEAELVEAVERPGADAVIVQLPLSEGVDVAAVLGAIPLEKDADVLSSRAYEAFVAGGPDALLPPVVGAVAEILQRAEVSPKGKRATVIGSGRLVGQPVAAWLSHEGATVSIHTKEEGDLGTLSDADIIVSGAGVPGLITPDLLAPAVALIDAGTSESGGAIVGDAVPECAEVSSVFTPVPGGVGPIAVACLFKNAAELVKRQVASAS